MAIPMISGASPGRALGGAGSPITTAGPAPAPNDAPADVFEPGATGAETGYAARMDRWGQLEDEMERDHPGWTAQCRSDPKTGAGAFMEFVARQDDGLAVLARTDPSQLHGAAWRLLRGDENATNALSQALHKEFGRVFTNRMNERVVGLAQARYDGAAAELDALASDPAGAARLLARDEKRWSFLTRLGYDVGDIGRLGSAPSDQDLAGLSANLRAAAADLRGLADRETGLDIDPRKYPAIYGRVARDLGATPYALQSLVGNGTMPELMWRLFAGGDRVTTTGASLDDFARRLLGAPFGRVAELLDLFPAPVTLGTNAAEAGIRVFTAVTGRRAGAARDFAGVQVRP